MDIARKLGHAKYVNDHTGFTGQGVHVEVIDLQDPYTSQFPFQGDTIIAHHADGRGPCEAMDEGQDPTDYSHGTSTFGELFWRNAQSLETADRIGMVPGAVAVHASMCRLHEFPPCSASANNNVDRDTHLCQLAVSDAGASNCCEEGDDNCPYHVVVQSNSVCTGHGSDYNASLDDSLFRYDLLMAYAQGDYGATASCIEAWSKNVVSIGGVTHHDTLGTTDDEYIATGDLPASVGPSSDGRIKPDLTDLFDHVDTVTYDCNLYTPTIASFGGTSSATPIAAGYFALFFQLWHEGVFRVCDGSTCVQSGGGASVFSDRAHSASAKAIMINTASLYDPAERPSFTRFNQGWGLPDIGRAYLLRNSFPIIIDETQLLDDDSNSTVSYAVSVPTDTYALRATLVWRDPPPSGNCGSGTPCLVNDLDLKVNPPSGNTCYWGNDGLITSNWSSSTTSCSPLSTHIDHLNNVENVFVQSPASGTWTVSVSVASLGADGHIDYVNDDPSECIPNEEGCVLTEEGHPWDTAFALVVSLDADCNQNGQSDADDILKDTESDHNCNGIPDSCDDEQAVTGACCDYNDGSCRTLSECECAGRGGTFNTYGCLAIGACCGYDGGTCTGAVNACECYAHGGSIWLPGFSCGGRHSVCDSYGPEGGGGP